MRQLITLLGLFYLTNIFGQEFKKINYQIDIGTTLTVPYKKTIEVMTEYEGHPVTDYSSNMGYFFEFLISYNINTKFSIESGLNYNYSKLKINSSIGFTDNKGHLTSSYIGLPIMIKYRALDYLSIACGPYFGLLLSVKEKGTSYIDTSAFIYPGGDLDPGFQIIEPVQGYNNDITERYKDFDFGLSGQVTYDIKLGDKLTGLIFTRFNYGLINCIVDDINYKWKNYNLIIGLGIKI
jgi:Outer membrane protein beta-barrel domain